MQGSISCEGHEFSSAKEFAAFYGLNYPNAQHYLRRGKRPEEVIELCRFSSAGRRQSQPKSSAKRYAFTYQGVEYPSLYAAANALGFNPAKLYELRKRNNLTPEGVIDLAVQRRAEKGKGAANRAHPCVVEGIEYESQEAAIKAYNVPRITVYSRMEREHISFEEALVRGRKSAIYCPPTMSLFPTLHLVPTEHIRQPVLEALADSLAYYKLKVTLMQDLLTLLPVLLVENNIYVFFNHAAHGLEFVSILPGEMDAETLNVINGAFVNTKVFFSTLSRQTILSAFQVAKEEHQELKGVLYAFFSYSAVRERLLRNLAAQDAGSVSAVAAFSPM